MINNPTFIRNQFLSLAAILSMSPFLLGAEGSALYRQHCDSCHGKDGKIKAMKVSRQLVGISKSELSATLQKYKNGTLDKYGQGFLMTATTAKLSNADIEAIANFVSELK